jgi:hypothetical protein
MARTVPTTITTNPETALENASDEAADLDYVPRTELGRLAMAARREYLASGGELLSREEIAREVTDRRGGARRHDER